MRLLPQKTSFFDLFDQHADALVTIARELRDMLTFFDQLPERQARIKELEHRCDEITHALAREMHGTFITPLDKEDIAALYSGLDDVADSADAAAVRLIIYQIPESSAESRELAELLVRAVEVLQGAVCCLRTTRDRDRIFEACRQIHTLENESDAIYRRALGKLFNTPGVDPIAVLKWKEIYERLEMAVDKVEDVSNVLEAIQLKYA
jgi:predicted phosphate transport protein (TIGR00153 family)